MSKIIYNLVYNRKRSLNKKGMALVQVEAYLDRKKKYFSTKVYLWGIERSGFFNGREKWAKGFENQRV